MGESYDDRDKSTRTPRATPRARGESCRPQKDARTNDVSGKSTLTVQIQANRTPKGRPYLLRPRLPNAISYTGISLVLRGARPSNRWELHHSTENSPLTRWWPSDCHRSVGNRRGDSFNAEQKRTYFANEVHRTNISNIRIIACL